MDARLVRPARLLALACIAALAVLGAASPLADRCARLDASLSRVPVRVVAGDSVMAIAGDLLAEARRSGEPAALLPALHAAARIRDVRFDESGRDSLIAAGLELAREEQDARWTARFLLLGSAQQSRARRPAPIDSVAGLLDEAATAARDPGLQAEATRMRAEAAMLRGEWAAAESLHLGSLPGLRAAARAASQVRVHTSLGQVLAMLARPERAAAHLDSAAALATAADEPGLLLGALGNQATLLYFRGRYEAGLEVTRRMVPLAAASRDSADRFPVLDRLISFTLELGRPHEAARYADTMAVLAERLARPAWTLRARQMLAQSALVGGHPELAVAGYRSLLMQGDALDAFNQRMVVTNLGSALAQQDSLVEACALLSAHLDGPLFAAPLDRSRALNHLGMWQLRLGDARAARRSVDEAIVLARQVDDRGRVLTLNTLLALVHGAAEQPALAWARYDTARAMWEEYRAGARTSEWREVASSLGQDLAWTVLRLSADFPEHERVSGPQCPAAALFDAIEALRGRALLERIRPGAGAGAAAVAPATAVTLQSRVLQPGELLLSAFVCPDSAVVFALDRDSLSVHAIALSRRTDIARVQSLHRLLATPPAERDPAATAAMDSGLAWARRELMAPLAPRLARARSVIVAPDGVLGLLPLGPLLESVVREPDSLQVTQVASASVLAAIRERASASLAPTDSVLAMSGPDPERVDTDLPGATQEVAWLARQFHRVMRGSAGAMHEHAWSRFAVLHLAVHSQADDEAPWRSAMRVGREPERGWQGMVEASDISQLDLRAHLAVLSSCQTAQSRQLSGEGLIGLSTAFIVAGVPSVLATQWRVDDATVEHAVRRFYAHLAQGQSAAAALAATRRELAARHASADPFHWAGLVLVGEPATLVRLSPRTPLERLATPWSLAVAVAGLAIAAAIAWRRRRGSGQAQRQIA